MYESEVAIVSAVRTPIGKFNGVFKEFSAIQLGAAAIQEVIRRANIEDSLVQEVLMGNVLQAGLGQNPARQASLLAGLSTEIPATTINQVCGSGLKAIQLAYQSIRSGEHDFIVAGGMENMSHAPYLLKGARTGYGMGEQVLVDSMIKDGLWCAENDYHMGITAENLCNQYDLRREELDSYSLGSQRKAAAAVVEGKFKDEIVPVHVPGRKGSVIITDSDEYMRPDTTMEGLSALRPAFMKDGKVTAGNSSGINDGAAACLLMSRAKAQSLGIRPMAIIRSSSVVGVDPAIMGIGPIPATEQALRKAGLTIKNIDLIEANEAFAAQSLVFSKHFELNDDKLNVNGGAIALGHPIGASGARIIVTLLYEMMRRESRYGLATLCVGGGQGISIIVERCLDEQEEAVK
ncbi:acetyl-CoA C-acetyltransferase [Paenibacillus sp. FSL H7-0331]|uniref:acetyl-CoA C-acetyltransferase n=1 Tax=Paenibacillus sp. FSL H7-0331 TaxID=1920421 RepID=UPI00096F15C9|nr:acetyl-CoA C-acetyltransferase [Paenibacillus sp. FSL H7-0331]OMF00503.1 acetyl-CoA acetyltransferase [Paenibacillus sp. FSL H7-0331]